MAQIHTRGFTGEMCPRPPCAMLATQADTHTYIHTADEKNTPCPFLPVTLLTFDFFARAPQTLRIFRAALFTSKTASEMQPVALQYGQ